MNSSEQIQQEPSASDAARWKIARRKGKENEVRRFMLLGMSIGLLLAPIAVTIFFVQGSGSSMAASAQRHGAVAEFSVSVVVVAITLGGGFMGGLLLGRFLFSLKHFFRPLYVALFRTETEFKREYGQNDDAIEVQVTSQQGGKQRDPGMPVFKRPVFFGETYNIVFVIANTAALLFSGLLRGTPDLTATPFERYFLMNPPVFAISCGLLASLLVFLGRLLYYWIRPYRTASLPDDRTSAVELLRGAGHDRQISKAADADIRSDE
jgi:hypothetical protein